MSFVQLAVVKDEIIFLPCMYTQVMFIFSHLLRANAGVIGNKRVDWLINGLLRAGD